jgi:hypothetical protein
MMSITTALQLTIEDLQGMSNEDLRTLHSLLADSKQKKASRKLDLVEGVLKGRKEEKPEQEEPKEEKTPEPIENSVKTPSKKPTVKGKKPTVKTGGKKPTEKKPTPQEQLDAIQKKQEQQAEQENEQEQEQEQKKQEQEKKPAPKPKSLKKPKEEQIDLTKLSQAELLEYVKQLEAKTETFPETIEGSKVDFKKIEFDNVQEIQKLLVKRPYELFLFCDEKYDDNKNTCFIVLFANPEIVVLLDRNRQKNSTITLKTEQLTATHLLFPKDKTKFEYAFYTKEAK